MKYFIVRSDGGWCTMMTIYAAESVADLPAVDDSDDVEELELGDGDPNDPYIYRAPEYQ